MFTYNARTEWSSEGTVFIEKDVILFDYSYSGDCVLRVDAVLKTPGFGFVIQEDDNGDQQAASNIVLITFSNDNSYQVILQNAGEQSTAVYQFIETATTLYDAEGTSFAFKKHNNVLTVFKVVRQPDGSRRELRLLEYKMQYDMERYWLGIYSSGGNRLLHSAIETEAPSNWISNVINANGGRIKWIKNGFTIEEARYDIEVEAENIEMKAGTYWLDYKTDNPDMKAYVFLTKRTHTKKDQEHRRQRDEIIDSMIDEEKNILGDDGKFVIKTDHNINIKFKGKWGTVTNIALKNDKYADFVETSYGMTTRPGSKLRFDLNQIKKIHMAGTIISIPQEDLGEEKEYAIFRRGATKASVIYPIQIDKEQTYDFTAETGWLQVDGINYKQFIEDDPELIAFDNVTAVISELIVTLHSGETINVLLQKTVRISVTNTINSPIIITDSTGTPLDLSSSYRLLSTIEPKLELFNALNPIHLKYYPDISDPNIKIYGIPYSTVVNNGTVVQTIDKTANTIDQMTAYYTEIKTPQNPELLLQKTIKIPYEIKEKYQYIAVSYNAITDVRYRFTNNAREIFDLSTESSIYLACNPLNANEDLCIYGIKSGAAFNDRLLHHIKNKNTENSINLCACDYNYDILDPNSYKINVLNKVIIDSSVLQQYTYLIIDYLKADSYSINEEDHYYIVDISSLDTKFKIMYDSADGMITNSYHMLTSIEDMIPYNSGEDEKYKIENNDFVALEI